MRTVVIRMDEPWENGSGYPILLQELNPATGEFGRVLGMGQIPHPLPVAEGMDAEADATDAAEHWIDDVLHDPQCGRHEEVGRYLHWLLSAAGAAGTGWSRLRAEVAGPRLCESHSGPEPELCTYLDIRPAALRRLPWEFMTDGEQPVFLSRRHRVMRGSPERQQQTGAAAAEADPALPIRVLVVVCDEAEELRAQDELDVIYAGLRDQPGVWQIDVIREPSWGALKERLDEFPPDILHVIAHTERIDPAEFAVRGEDTVTGDDHWPLSVDRIHDLLNARKAPVLLLLLNACYTAGPISERFHSLGARAVITTQMAIESDAAVCFAETFYRRLAENGSVADAVWHARNAMHVRDRLPSYDWAVPVLTVFGSPDQVMPHDVAGLGRKSSEFMRTDSYGRANLMFDRIAKHQKVWRSIYPDQGGGKQKHLVVLSGREDAGKTQLLKSTMLTWRLRGHRAIMANMKAIADRSCPGAGEVLRQICQALLGEELTGEEVSAAHGFMAALDGDLLEAGGSADSSPFDEPCAQLVRLLRTIASERHPVLIALDHIEKIGPAELCHPIRNKFLLPVSRGEAGRVYIITAIRQEALNKGGLGWGQGGEDWPHGTENIVIDAFEAHEFVPLGREFGARKGWLTEADRRWHDLLLAAAPDQAWLPRKLLRLAEFYESSRGYS